MSMDANMWDEDRLDRALDAASPPPDVPSAQIEARALAAFDTQFNPSRKAQMGRWATGLTALAASVVLGFGGFMALQSHSANQQAIATDADDFAEQLLSETF